MIWNNSKKIPASIVRRGISAWQICFFFDDIFPRESGMKKELLTAVRQNDQGID
jgi:hypothetical protein